MTLPFVWLSTFSIIVAFRKLAFAWCRSEKRLGCGVLGSLDPSIWTISDGMMLTKPGGGGLIRAKPASVKWRTAGYQLVQASERLLLTAKTFTSKSSRPLWSVVRSTSLRGRLSRISWPRPTDQNRLIVGARGRARSHGPYTPPATCGRRTGLGLRGGEAHLHRTVVLTGRSTLVLLRSAEQRWSDGGPLWQTCAVRGGLLAVCIRLGGVATWIHVMLTLQGAHRSPRDSSPSGRSRRGRGLRVRNKPCTVTRSTGSSSPRSIPMGTEEQGKEQLGWKNSR